MFHVYIVRKNDNYGVRFINSVVSSTGIKTSAILAESKISMTPEIAVDRAESLIDALINANLPVEPALGLTEELGAGDEN